MEVPAHGPLIASRRIGYRIASALITADRRMRQSRGRGVKLVLDDGAESVLLVRHAYGQRHWTFPGGGIRTGEAPGSAAARECSEELGALPLALEDLGSYPGVSGRRTEVVSVFGGTIDRESLRPCPAELAEIAWFRRHELPRDIDPKALTALGLRSGRDAEVSALGRHRTA